MSGGYTKLFKACFVMTREEAVSSLRSFAALENRHSLLRPQLPQIHLVTLLLAQSSALGTGSQAPLGSLRVYTFPAPLQLTFLPAALKILFWSAIWTGGGSSSHAFHVLQNNFLQTGVIFVCLKIWATETPRPARMFLFHPLSAITGRGRKTGVSPMNGRKSSMREKEIAIITIIRSRFKNVILPQVKRLGLRDVRHPAQRHRADACGKI